MNRAKPSRFWLHGIMGMLCMGLACAAQAQHIYRHVGKDGRVTYSDRAPLTVQQAAEPSSSADSSFAATNPKTVNTQELPPSLRQVATRYPVTLYTFSGCNTCNEARLHLQQRGIPFQERTVNTDADKQQFLQLSPDGVMPFLTIGSQQLPGFGEAEWDSYLRAAGYPAQSALPRNYRQPAAISLVPEPPLTATSPTIEEPTTASPEIVPAAIETSPPNPAGISF